LTSGRITRSFPTTSKLPFSTTGALSPLSTTTTRAGTSCTTTHWFPPAIFVILA
ncbi:hypothetical protein LPJ81_005522, partial [Coemansia sp. IMI 209127]